MEPEVRRRFERIEAILESIAKRQDGARWQVRYEKRIRASGARPDRIDKQLQTTAKLVSEAAKVVRTFPQDTRELKRSQKAFLDSLRHSGNGRGSAR